MSELVWGIVGSGVAFATFSPAEALGEVLAEHPELVGVGALLDSGKRAQIQALVEEKAKVRIAVGGLLGSIVGYYL